MEEGDRTAVILTVIASAHRHDLDVWAYLRNILERLAKGAPTFYPSHQPAPRPHAHLVPAACPNCRYVISSRRRRLSHVRERLK